MKNPTFFYNQMDFTLHARITTFVHPFQPVFYNDSDKFC